VSLSFIDTVKSSKKENPRVQQIKEQLANGTYRIPSGSAILDKVPQFAELF
jgi:anti-sigma28 factor (negative regulator of flagellin synthesis)